MHGQAALCRHRPQRSSGARINASACQVEQLQLGQRVQQLPQLSLGWVQPAVSPQAQALQPRGLQQCWRQPPKRVAIQAECAKACRQGSGVPRQVVVVRAITLQLYTSAIETVCAPAAVCGACIACTPAK